jgi:hypothetical protein
MFLDTSALYLLERHRAFEAELERDALQSRQRAELWFARAGARDAESNGSAGVGGVALGDGSGRRDDLRPDIGRPKHLDPTPGAEQHAGRFVRPIHP